MDVMGSFDVLIFFLLGSIVLCECNLFVKDYGSFKSRLKRCVKMLNWNQKVADSTSTECFPKLSDLI